MATKSITSLGLGNADLTAIGKLSETGLSQVEIADAVVEGDKLKKGNKVVAYDGHLANTSNPHSTTAGQVGAYTKAEVDFPDVSPVKGALRLYLKQTKEVVPSTT